MSFNKDTEMKSAVHCAFA